MFLRMYCIDTEALVFMFNGGSPCSFSIHPIFTQKVLCHWIIVIWHPSAIYLPTVIAKYAGHVWQTSADVRQRGQTLPDILSSRVQYT